MLKHIISITLASVFLFVTLAATTPVNVENSNTDGNGGAGNNDQGDFSENGGGSHNGKHSCSSVGIGNVGNSSGSEDYNDGNEVDAEKSSDEDENFSFYDTFIPDLLVEQFYKMFTYWDDDQNFSGFIQRQLKFLELMLKEKLREQLKTIGLKDLLKTIGLKDLLKTIGLKDLLIIVK
ncbi:13514_t:CDS:2 [Ambispora leptoticha]|uniref:13514_t:CDS:1 n=1 Tax=Ambispora leptoticha TaxID=144679 RepID=A0A9N8YYT0_9GLOM|nr:13514_t:CDS:2 [Ambispora leptoticha]